MVGNNTDAGRPTLWSPAIQTPFAPVTDALTGLGLGARQSGETESATEADLVPETTGTEERGPLRIALGINATFFVVEFAAGLVSGSMGLVADSLDNLADALVYALSLAAVGGAAARKKQLARYSAYLQGGLAAFGLVEVVRRFVFGDGVPDVATMIVVASLTLLGNVATLLVLRRARGGSGTEGGGSRGGAVSRRRDGKTTRGRHRPADRRR